MSRTIGTKETACLERAALRAAWPGVKFSVRMGTATAGCWLSVSWSDGPTEVQVRRVTHPFQGSQFNGMTDSYDDLGARLVATEAGELPEEIRYVVDGVTHTRTMGDLGRAWVEATITRVTPEVRIYDERGRYDWRALTEQQQNRLMRETHSTGRHPPLDIGQAAHQLFYGLDLSETGDRS